MSLTEMITPLHDLQKEGFTIIEEVYSNAEIDQLLYIINDANSTNKTFRKAKDIFAIRQVLKEIPGLTPIIFNERLLEIIQTRFGKNYFVVKSIYFDKPASSNWYVAYHQDLTISVNEKSPVEGYFNWTKKHDQFAVQPPTELLENIFTIRIHLDDTDAENGALNVIPQSHSKGIIRPETIQLDRESEFSCAVPKGGIMIMKPLLLHSSGRTTNDKQRRVIHIEFSNQELPEGLNWSERMETSKLF